ncbi:MAG TPA: hypothetical protein PLR82_05025 [Bacillota bacterium]|nr:hypothetical protein [Bacillota bacterium]
MLTPLEAIDSFRAIIEHGKNTSTYKMALALAIARLVEGNKRHVNKRELAGLFFEIYLVRLEVDMPQLSDPTKSARVEQAIAGFKSGSLTREQAISRIEKEAFCDVLPRFHTVNGVQVPVKFYTYSSSGLALTDAAFMVFQSSERDKLLREVDSKWSFLEETFARNRLGDNVSVWVVSSGASGRKGELWCCASASDGAILAMGGDMKQFARGVAKDLASGQKVCLGFQGPLTLLVPEQSGVSPRFHCARSEHPAVAGRTPVDETPRAAKPTHRRLTLRKLADPVRAVICAARVMRDIKNSSPDTSEPTLNWRRFVDNRSNLFVWEASGSREYRQRAETDPARLAINRFLNPYPRLYPQLPPEGYEPFSLVAAALSWAGFQVEQDSFRMLSVVV